VLLFLSCIVDNIMSSFVDRYIPGYVFFGDGVTKGLSSGEGTETKQLPSWIGKGLSVTIGDDREFLYASNF
jgi:D-glycerate 3-kinase